MEGIARSEATVIDLTASGNANIIGLTAVQGITERGFMQTPQVVRTWSEYQRYYGGLTTYSQFPLLCKICLDNGCPLLVSRIGHYTDIEDTSTLIGQASAASYTYGGWGIDMEATSIGSWGANLNVDILDAASGNTANVDIRVSLLNDDRYTYIVPDVPSNTTLADIEDFNTKSRFVKITSTYGQLVATGGLAFTGGLEDYSNIAYGDYAGNAVTKTGWHAFDEAVKYIRLAILEHTPTQIVKQQEGLIAYAETVQRMSYFPAPLGLTGYEVTDFRKRQGTYTGSPIPNSWVSRLIYGDFNMKHPETGANILVPALPFWLGAAAKKDRDTKKIWLSEAGQKRGRIKGVLSINYNLAVAARREEADAVDSSGISMAINHDTFGFVCWGNGTLALGNTLLRHANVAELILEAIRITNARNEEELFDPNDIPTWRTIFRKVNAAFTDIKNAQGVYDFIYEGDQNIDTIDEATVNTVENIMDGEYIYYLYLRPTVAMKYVKVRMVVTASNTTATVVE